MASQAIRFFERLVVVRLLQIRTLGIVAVQTEGWRHLGQMEIKFGLSNLSGLMRDVAGVATHVEGCVSAALCRDIQAGLVAAQAEVLFLIARDWLQQLILVIGDVRVVALKTVSHCGGVNLTFYVGGIFVCVASKTQCVRSGRDQLDVSYIFDCADLMAAGATHGNRRMH
jgi:hypothetical protein